MGNHSSSEEPGTSTGGVTPRVPGPSWQLWHCYLAGSAHTFSPHGSTSCLPYSWWLGWTQCTKLRWGVSLKVVLRGNLMKFPLHPLTLRTWVIIPQWWYLIGTWFQWPGCSQPSSLYPRGIKGISSISFKDGPSPRPAPQLLEHQEDGRRHLLQGLYCLQEGCRSCFTNKESVCSSICAAHSHTVLFCPWVRLDGCCPCPDYFQNWEPFRKHLSSVHGAGLEMTYGCEESEAK